MPHDLESVYRCSNIGRYAKTRFSKRDQVGRHCHRTGIGESMAGLRLRQRGWIVVALAATLGCAATQSVHRQRFLELRTPHFEIMSSLGDARTRALARDLELFHTGVEYALELPLSNSTPVPTRVYAFDDRGFTRPFALRGAKVYLVPLVEAPLLVFRTPEDWDERATRLVRERYARRLLRRRDPTRRPLWYEEGLGQFASTVEIDPPRVRVGGIVVEHVQALRDWNANSLAPLFNARDLSRRSPNAIELFRAQAWALIHTLKFRDARTRGPSALTRYLEAIATHQKNPVRSAFGTNEKELAEEVYEHIRQSEFQEIAVRPDEAWSAANLDLGTPPFDRAHLALGNLALAIGKSKLAREYFDRALSANPSNAHAHAGLGATAAAAERWQDADAHLKRALALGPDDPRNHRIAGDILVAEARATESTPDRKRFVDLARTHYQRSLELDTQNVEARVGFAATCVFEKQDAERGLEWLETARALRPGALEIDLLAARLEATLGRPSSARLLAADALSRTRWPATEKAARAILERADPPSGG